MSEIRKSNVNLQDFKNQGKMLNETLEIDLSEIKEGCKINYKLTSSIVDENAKREEALKKDMYSQMKKDLLKQGVKINANSSNLIVANFIDKISQDEFDERQFEMRLKTAEEFLYSFDRITQDEVLNWFKEIFGDDFYRNKYNDFVISILNEYENFVMEFAKSPR